jgi:hypothetical protein
MKQVQIDNTVFIARRPDEIFAFAATPRTWPMWHPTATSVSGVTERPIEAGDEVLETDRFAFLRGSILWAVRRATPGAGWAIDGVLSGVPLASGTRTSVSYALTEVDGGTRFERSMTYSIPSPVFRLLDAAYFERHNRHQSQRAVDGLKALLERGADLSEPTTREERS